MQRIVLVGSYPPPHAGNSVHIEKLAERLVADGYATTVADPYAARAALYTPGSGPSPVFRKGFCALAYYLWAHARAAIVHLHMSAGKRFYRVAPLLFALTGRARRRVLTIHSGSFLKEFRSLAPNRRRRATRTLSRFDEIICVNGEQRDFLLGQVPGRLSVIPAFLPCRRRAGAALPESIRALRQSVDVTLITSGTGEALYDQGTVLRGVEEAQKRLGVRLGLVVATYKAWDAAYWDPLEREMRQSSVPVVVTRSLAPDEFFNVLGAMDFYVRASLTDGDAMAVREAAAAGARVLATDVVSRPHGTALFPARDPARLAELIVAAVEDRTVGRLPPETTADTYRAILAVYGLARSEPALAAV